MSPLYGLHTTDVFFNSVLFVCTFNRYLNNSLKQCLFLFIVYSSQVIPLQIFFRISSIQAFRQSASRSVAVGFLLFTSRRLFPIFISSHLNFLPKIAQVAFNFLFNMFFYPKYFGDVTFYYVFIPWFFTSIFSSAFQWPFNSLTIIVSLFYSKDKLLCCYKYRTICSLTYSLCVSANAF